MAEKKSVSESDTIILTLHERWWKKMLAGEKILEIRKTAPVQKDREYRVLVYVTGGGGVCGEFTCTDFMKIKMLPALLETHKKQRLPDRKPDKGIRRGKQKEFMGLGSHGCERILQHAPVRALRAEKAAAVMVLLQRAGSAGHHDN